MDGNKGIRERIEQLPKGNLTRKTIKGHTYTYLQWREDGKVRSRVVHEKELPTVKRLIAENSAAIAPDAMLDDLDQAEIDRLQERIRSGQRAVVCW